MTTKDNVVLLWCFGIGFLTHQAILLASAVARVEGDIIAIGNKKSQPQNTEWSSWNETEVDKPVSSKSGLGSSTRSSLECRLQWDLEKKVNLTSKWLEMELPILVSAIRQNRGGNGTNAQGKLETRNRKRTQNYYQYTTEDIVSITLTQRPGRQRQKAMDFQAIQWNCIYERNRLNGHLQALAAMGPRQKHSEDIIHLICNFTMEDMALKGVSPSVLSKRNDTDANQKLFVYDVETPLECDRLEERETARIHEQKKLGILREKT